MAFQVIPVKEPMMDLSGSFAGLPTVRWVQWFGRVFNVCNAVTTSGTTANRPTQDLFIGMPYFDTTLGTPIWLSSLGPTVWVDATGAAA